MKELISYNQRGWIPGPLEEEKPFKERISKLNEFFSTPPEDIDHFLTDTDWINAQIKLSTLYDFSPDWIVAHYSNQNLSFFQGAATWITQKEDLRIPLIQMREKFEKGKLLRHYGRDEVLAHEGVHAARMQFDEPLFEEIFAYKTSPKLWRRFFGPLFQHTWEAYVFIALLLFPIAYEIAPFFPIDIEDYSLLRFLPLCFFGYLFLRLVFLQTVLCIALFRVKKLLKNPQKKWAFVFRLTDREIFQACFGRNLQKWMKEQKGLRWKLLRTYFKT